MEQIGDGAFSNCTDLLTVVFKDGVKVIGNNMFYACFYLQTVIIPDSVETIGKNAFIACNRLTAAYYEGSEEEWNKIEAENTELSPNVVYFYSLEQPSAEGNYWHYVDSVPVIW